MTLSEGIPSDDISRRWCRSVRQTDGVGVVVYLKRFTGSWEGGGGGGGGGGSGGVPPPLPGTVADHPRVPAHPFGQLQWYGPASQQQSTCWGHESERIGRVREEAQRKA